MNEPKIWLSSDLHFGHDRQFLWGPRGFSSIEEHDKTIIENWNSRVGKGDIVYILGDIMLNNNDHGMECLRQLHGFKYFVRGNHDTDTRWKLYPQTGETVGDAWRLNYRKYHFYLSHFPTMTGNFEKEHPRQMTLCLCGHTHSKEKFYNGLPYIYNVALDAHDNCPVLLDNIIEDIKAEFRKCWEQTGEEVPEAVMKEIAPAPPERSDEAATANIESNTSLKESAQRQTEEMCNNIARLFAVDEKDIEKVADAFNNVSTGYPVGSNDIKEAVKNHCWYMGNFGPEPMNTVLKSEMDTYIDNFYEVDKAAGVVDTFPSRTVKHVHAHLKYPCKDCYNCIYVDNHCSYKSFIGYYGCDHCVSATYVGTCDGCKHEPHCLDAAYTEANRCRIWVEE